MSLRGPFFLSLTGLILSAACQRHAAPSAGQTDRDVPPKAATPDRDHPACSDVPIPRHRSPGTEARHETVAFWLNTLAAPKDQAPLTSADISAINRKSETIEGGFRHALDPKLGDPARTAAELSERRIWLKERVASGRYVEGTPGALGAAMQRIDASQQTDRLHLVAHEANLWCVPTRAGLFTEPVDRDFDRNRCASLHPGEAVRVLRSHPEAEWLYVHAGHSVGWLFRPELTPRLTADELSRYQRPDRRLLVVADRAATTGPKDAPVLRLGTSVPLVGQTEHSYRVLVPTRRGIDEAEIALTGRVAAPPFAFTPRRVIRLALEHLDRPYGWGGKDGGYDCSRFLYDLFGTFDVSLARHSGIQSQLGTSTRNVKDLDEPSKRTAIREAARSGVVLLYMPGHIMLYLGEDSGHMYAISAISEYLEPCASDRDTTYRLDRVAVTTLELGRDTQRRAFIQRITRIAVFGPNAASAPHSG